MITDSGKYYLYRHIREDKDTPFYIGVGTKQEKYWRTNKSEYYRAYTFHKENSIWKHIINKTPFRVEILLESNDYSFILKKEQEFITLYGRINNKTGILANLTNGGEKNQGRVCKPLSDTHRKILSERMKKNNPNKDGKWNPFQIPGVRDKVIKRMKENNPRHTSSYVWEKKVYLYDLKGKFIKEFASYAEVSKYLGTSKSSVSTYFSEKRKIIKGHVLYKDFKGEFTKVDLNRKVKYKSVLVYFNGHLLKECRFLKECFNIVPFSKAMVYKILRKNNDCNEYLGYRIYYKEDTRLPLIIRDLSKKETLADLMQNNPNLTKEELLYWCPEFQEPLSQVVQEPNGHFIVGYDDVPGIKGTQFKIKLSKEHFSGNMTPEQIQDIAEEYKDYL